MRILAFAFFLCLAANVLHAADGNERLNNQDVIDMLKAGLSADLVMTKIRTSDNAFDTSARALIELAEQGVPEAIIELMLTKVSERKDRIKSKVGLEIQHLASEQENLRRTAETYLTGLGAAAFPQLRAALSKGRPEIRAAAASFLGKQGDKEAAPQLRTLLNDTDPRVRHAAATALAKIGDTAILPLARKAVADQVAPLDGYLRYLGNMKDVKSVDRIRIILIQSPDKIARALSAWALGEIGDPDARTDLERALSVETERSAEVRREAALALGKLAEPASFPVLKRACVTDREVRLETLEALRHFPAEDAVGFLVLALTQGLNPAETKAAVSSLRHLTKQNFGDDVQKWRRWYETEFDKAAPTPNTTHPAPPTEPKAPTLPPELPDAEPPRPPAPLPGLDEAVPGVPPEEEENGGTGLLPPPERGSVRITTDEAMRLSHLEEPADSPEVSAPIESSPVQNGTESVKEQQVALQPLPLDASWVEEDIRQMGSPTDPVTRRQNELLRAARRRRAPPATKEAFSDELMSRTDIPGIVHLHPESTPQRNRPVAIVAEADTYTPPVPSDARDETTTQAGPKPHSESSSMVVDNPAAAAKASDPASTAKPGDPEAAPEEMNTDGLVTAPETAAKADTPRPAAKQVQNPTGARPPFTTDEYYAP